MKCKIDYIVISKNGGVISLTCQHTGDNLKFTLFLTNNIFATNFLIVTQLGPSNQPHLANILS